MFKNEVSISKAMPIVIAVIFLSAVLSVTFYYLSFKKSTPAAVAPTITQIPNTIPAPTPDDVPTPTPTPDETADWKVYRNEEYGYEIKYPPEWQGGEESLVTQVASFTPEKRDIAQTGFWIYAYENQKKLSAKDWWIKEYEKGNAKYFYKGTIQFSGINMEVYKEEDGLEFTYYIFSKNSDIYLIMSPIIEEKMYQILSTFKLTEKDETADWKTYQNKDYGISFQYPSTWLLEKDGSADINLFGISFTVENINSTLSVIGITNKYVEEGPSGWFGYCAVAYKNVDQFCEGGCTRINDKTATRRGMENHGDAGYSLLAYTNISKKFPSICWELDLSSLLSEIAKKKNISYYKITNEDMETYLKENSASEDIKNIIKKFEEFSQSIKSF